MARTIAGRAITYTVNVYPPTNHTGVLAVHARVFVGSCRVHSTTLRVIGAVIASQ